MHGEGMSVFAVQSRSKIVGTGRTCLGVIGKGLCINLEPNTTTLFVTLRALVRLTD